MCIQIKWFNRTYIVRCLNVKWSGRFYQIFVAFLKNLNLPKILLPSTLFLCFYTCASPKEVQFKFFLLYPDFSAWELANFFLLFFALAVLCLLYLIDTEKKLRQTYLLSVKSFSQVLKCRWCECTCIVR